MKMVAGLVALAVAVSSCGRAGMVAPPDTLTAEFVAAFNAKDAAKVASFYTDDGQLAAPGASPIKGRDAIAAALAVTFGQGTTLQLARAESQAAGSIAFEAGTFTLTMENLHDAANPEVLVGEYLAVFKRIGNEWKLAYHIFTAGQVA